MAIRRAFAALTALAASLVAGALACAAPSAESREARPAPRVAGLRGPTGIGMVRLLEQETAVASVSVAYELAASPGLVASRVLRESSISRSFPPTSRPRSTRAVCVIASRP